MELAEITKALSENAELLTGVTSHILESEKGKEVIGNKAEILFNEKISGHVSGIYQKDDEQIFEILGVKPKVLEGGSKQKTNDLKKELFTELKKLRGQKDSLTKEAKVIELQNQIEQLKKDGGGAHWEKTFNTESEKWKTEKQLLIDRAETAENGASDSKKRSAIETALRDFKFDENIPKGAREALVKAEVSKLMLNSKIENGVVIFLDEKGAQISNSEFKPENASNILKDSLKEIISVQNNDGGGGAPATVKGSIETKTNADGNSVQTLNLPASSFKTKTEFQKVVEDALLSSGITKSDENWSKLKSEAYNRYKVADMPRN